MPAAKNNPNLDKNTQDCQGQYDEDQFKYSHKWSSGSYIFPMQYYHPIPYPSAGSA